jgi:hypothetical protein
VLGGIHKNLDRADQALDLVEQLGPGFPARDGQGPTHHLISGTPELLDDNAQVIGIDVRQDHADTLLSECRSHSPPSRRCHAGD